MEDITEKRKYSKDNVDAVKRRNAARTSRKPSGVINFTADSQQDIEKVQTLFNRVKSFIGGGSASSVSSKAALEEVFQFFICV